MKFTMPAALVLALAPGISDASADAVNSGTSALALAGVIAEASPLLTSAEQRAISMMFAETSDVPYKKKISVTADKIVCRTSNVDLTIRSCQLTFGKKTKTINGRAANQLFATLAMAGVAPDAAAGTNYESLANLTCTVDPQAIRQKDGSGAACSYEAAK